MKLQLYESIEEFGNDTLEILLENEVENNLPVGFILNSGELDTSSWFMAAVKDDSGSVVLTAVCTPPFNLVAYLTRNEQNDAAVKLLSDDIKAMGRKIPGVLAERSLAWSFAETHSGKSGFESHLSMNIMQLDSINVIPKAPGGMREICEEDMFFLPYWARAFSEDCRVETYTIEENAERIGKRIGGGKHYIWENGIPVSQAAHGRSTANGAVVNAVYTPPHYRGRGYASSVVAELSQLLLERGNKFCCLFADAKNPVSCGIYRKIGYADKCVVEELHFL